MKCVCGKQLKYIASSDGCGDLRCISCLRSSGYCSSVSEAIQEFSRRNNPVVNELTREQIMGMDSKKLNEAVAVHIMGWKKGHGVTWITGEKKHGKILQAWDIRPYSTDISAAWEVVEKMRQEHKQYITIIDNPHLNYDVRFSGSKSKEYHRLSNLPYAICRAAILAVMDCKD